MPLPHLAGNGNAGIFYGINVGTRVVAMFTAANSRDVTVITGLIPKPNLYGDTFKQRKPSDVPSGTFAYPTIREGDLILRGDRDARLALTNAGDAELTTVNGGGLYLKRNESRSSFILASEDLVNYSNGVKIISGPVRRMSGTKRNLFPKPDLTQTPLFADPNYAVRTVPYGFFTASRPLRRSYQNRKNVIQKLPNIVW